MKLSDLKDRINNKQPISFPLIFVNDGGDFLIDEYINAICNNLSLKPLHVNSIKEIEDVTSSMFYNNDNLFIYEPEKDVVVDMDRIGGVKVIIIYEKVPENKDLDYTIFPKLESWMVEDYAKVILPGLRKEESNWLCKICGYNINRVTLECEKISIFPKSNQGDIFSLINSENGYCDLSDMSIFNLSNAIIKRDIVGIKKVMTDIDYIDVEGTGLVTILLKQFLNIINVQLNNRATAQSLGMSEKQFRAIKYGCNIYSPKKLIDNYQFLNDIDRKLKGGYMEMDNKQLVMYIISNII